MSACGVQVSSVPVGLENLSTPSEESRRRAQDIAARAAKVNASGEGPRPKWRRGEIEFEALMRHLDNAVSSSNKPSPPQP